MVSRSRGRRALALLSGLFLACGPSLGDDAAPDRGLVPIDSRYSHAAGPEALVLEVRVSGGFGKMLGHVFRLYGDGRLEEILVWSDDRAGTVPVRDLPFPAESRDRFLRALVGAGVPGATRDSLVAELHARDPRFKDLIWGSDCLRVHFRLSLFEQGMAAGQTSEVVTELDLECTYKYREIYSESKRLVTLAASIDELLALSEAEGWD